MSIVFGPGGNSEQYYNEGYKSSLDRPGYLQKIGLNGYEYQCNKGVHISMDSARILGEEAKKYGVHLSIHSQYYVSLSSTEEEKRLKSVEYLLACFRVAKEMGADRIVVHSGSCAKMTRAKAYELSLDTLHKTLARAKEEGYEDIFLCPEVMGKINQLGDFDEVVKLCTTHEMLLPAIDFGHLNARTLGGLKAKEDYLQLFRKMEKKLGRDKAKIFHCHFSKIEYTNQGEKRHLTFEDIEFGPDYEPFLEAVYETGFTPMIICESAGTQDQDALSMQTYFRQLQKG
ncbi:MAG: TIM barrel protein [Clostridia bacterium]|nr:TIM barrel protein [Clostridia bacterium]